MRTFFRLKDGRPCGLTREITFLLVEELRVRHARAARGGVQAELPLRVHLLGGGSRNSFALDIDDGEAFDGVGGAEWAEFLSRLGVSVADDMPRHLAAESTFGSGELHRLASPETAAGNSARHVLLESTPDRFPQLLQEVAAHPTARASVVKLSCREHGLMVAVLAEFPEGASAGTLPQLFPSAHVVRVSEDGTRSAFSHVGSSCLWMVRHGVLLQSIHRGLADDEARAFITFGSDDGSLVIDICSWRREDELPVANFVKLVASAQKAPLLAGMAEGAVGELDIVLQREAAEGRQGSRVYVVDSSHPLSRRSLALLADAAELGLGGELEFACWRTATSHAPVYAFLSREPVGQLEQTHGVHVYALLDAPLRSARVAVRSGWRFLPYMPQEDAWQSAIGDALLGEGAPADGALLLVDPAARGDEVPFEARLIGGFGPFSSFRAHASVLGQAVHVQMLDVSPSDGARLPELSKDAEVSWTAAADEERRLVDLQTSALFEELRQVASEREKFMDDLRSEIDALTVAAQKFDGIPAEIETGVRHFARSLGSVVSAAGMESKKWQVLLRELESWRLRVEGHAAILEKTAELAMRDESERLGALQLSLGERRRSLEADEARMAADHAAALAISEGLDDSLASAEKEALAAQSRLAEVDRGVFDLEVLAERAALLQSVVHAHETARHEIRQKAAELSMRTEHVRSQMSLVSQESRRISDEMRKVELQAEQAAASQLDLRRQEELVRLKRSELVDARRQVDELGAQLRRAIGNADPRVEHAELTSRADALRGQIREIEKSKADIVRVGEELQSLAVRLEEVSAGHDHVRVGERIREGSATHRDLLDAIRALERSLSVTSALRAHSLPERTHAALLKMVGKAVESLSEARKVYLSGTPQRLRRVAKELDDQARLLLAKADAIDT